MLALSSRLRVALLVVAALSTACAEPRDFGGEGNSPGVGGAANGAGGGGSPPGTGGSATAQSGSGGLGTGCSSDADCGTDAAPHCLVATGTCVACTDEAHCDAGQYCDESAHTCEVGCADDTDCNSGVCDPDTHACVGCAADTDCAPGSVCAGSTCVPGCSAIQACQPGLTCCGTVCFDVGADVDHCSGCNAPCAPPAHASASCVASQCGLGACNAGWEDCNQNPVDGCEWNTLQDGPCACSPGAVQICYLGAPGTMGVGPCKAGSQTCSANGSSWGPCVGQVLPSSEICQNGVDEDCDGTLDNGADADGDGWGICNGDCCDDPATCASPGLVNPGAFEFVGNGINDDCNAATSDAVAPGPCINNAKFATVTGKDLAKAMDLCQFTTANPALPQKKWGVVTAEQLRANGAVPNANGLAKLQDWQSAVLTDYGTTIIPKKGPTMAALSTGKMRDAGDAGFVNPQAGTGFGAFGQPPAAYLAAHGGQLPAQSSCQGNCPAGNGANDSVNTRLTIRVPTNAQSFSYKFRFFSAEYAEFTCTDFNDFYLALLQSGAPGLPADKNITFDVQQNPVSVNNAFFQVCKASGCYTCPAGNAALVGTGMGGAVGGGTKWLTTEAPIVPGETIVLELMVFDVSDDIYDSVVLLDGFAWSAAPAQVGTHD